MHFYCGRHFFSGPSLHMAYYIPYAMICVESDKIPLLHKLKQLYKCLPVGFLIDITYTANNVLYKLDSKMAVYYAFGESI